MEPTELINLLAEAIKRNDNAEIGQIGHYVITWQGFEEYQRLYKQAYARAKAMTYNFIEFD